jgi:hypothetical protein
MELAQHHAEFWGLALAVLNIRIPLTELFSRAKSVAKSMVFKPLLRVYQPINI